MDAFLTSKYRRRGWSLLPPGSQHSQMTQSILSDLLVLFLSTQGQKTHTLVRKPAASHRASRCHLTCCISVINHLFQPYGLHSKLFWLKAEICIWSICVIMFGEFKENSKLMHVPLWSGTRQSSVRRCNWVGTKENLEGLYSLRVLSTARV